MTDPHATAGLRLGVSLPLLRRNPRWRTLRDYALLMRLDRPIGIFLLLWPPMWALWIASRGMPPLKLLGVFVAGTVVMRSAGCIINDFADRRIDPHVKRTRDRPLAARRVSPQEALVLFGLLVAVALWLVTRLDRHTVMLSFVGAGLTISYPFMKRFFPLPQFYLGAAFGWAVPMAFAATLGHIPKVGWLLFLVTVIWAGVYDTVYAMVDRDDDLRLDVRSTAILFGDMDRLIVGCLQGLVLLGLLLAGREAALGAPFYWSLGVGTGLFAWQQWLIRHRSRDGCFRAFLNNHWFGLAVFAWTVLAVR
jgi:4-hydroxybenzoate polyprenyltransferase